MNKIVITILWFFMTGLVLAQKHSQYTYLIEDKMNNQLVQVTQENIRTRVIEAGHYKGLNTIDCLTSISFPNGERKTLEENEVVTRISNGFIITSRFDIINHTITFKSYRLSKKEALFTGTVKLEGEHQIDILENGNIIITDQHESYGTTIKIYNSNLSLLTEFKPLEGGYESALFVSSKDKIFAVVRGAEPNVENTIIELSKTGTILNTHKASFSFLPVKLLTVNDKLIIIGFNEIACVHNGNTAWTLNVTLPQYDIVVNDQGNSICYALESRIVNISADNGNEIWHYDFDNDLKNNPLSTIRPVVFKVLKNRIAIVLANTNRGVLTSESELKDIQLLFIDLGGNVMRNGFRFNEKANTINLFEDNNKLILIIDQKEYPIHE